VAATPAAAPPAPIAEAPKPPQPTAAAEPTKPQAPASPPAIPAASTAPVKPLDPPAAPAVPAAPGQQLAALSTAAVGADGRLARIDFAIGGAELPEVARPALERAIGEMKRDENARLQLIAYASGGDEAGSQARRLSLSRALAVRSYLIDQGVRSTRVDVRALGNKVPEGPPDRVDVLLVRR
jgi:outer membrane protein OmpA-like peptidoglycan-associated protein